MKRNFARFSLLAMIAALGVSCTTAYDRSGRPNKVITPEGAVLGAAAVGVLAYSLGKDRKKRKTYHHYDHGYSKGHHDYRRGSRYHRNDSYRDYGYRHHNSAYRSATRCAPY